MVLTLLKVIAVIMFAQDSLANLRLHKQKRPEKCQSMAVLPMDQLRGLAKKRRRIDVPSSTFGGNSLFPRNSVVAGKKGVTFDLTKNTYREANVSAEILKEGWMTPEESEQLKTELRMKIIGIQEGTVSVENECVRGLEAHLDPELTNEKISKGRNFVSRILNQQMLLRSMMGKANDQILAKLSLLLSKDDAKHASETGDKDATDVGMQPKKDQTIPVSLPVEAEANPKTPALTGQTPQIKPQPPMNLMSFIGKKNHQAPGVLNHAPPMLNHRQPLPGNGIVGVSKDMQQQQQQQQPPKAQDSAMVAFLRARRGGSQVDLTRNNQQPVPN